MNFKKFSAKITKTPRYFHEYYNKKKLKLELTAIWFGFTAALGLWFLAASLVLLWVVIKGSGIYWFGIYIYLQGILGVFLGALLAGRRASVHGWLHGLWVGILLGMLGIIINLEMMPQIYTWSAISRQLLVWSLWGLAGGYVGYHLKGRSKTKSKRAFLDKGPTNR